MTKKRRPAAYHGRGWRPRSAAMAAEIASGGAWSSFRLDSEYKRLKAVLLYVPGRELAAVRSPNAVQHLAKIDVGALRREFGRLAAAFRRNGVAVHLLRGAGRRAPPNLMFMRDLFFPTPEGAVLARMASQVRAGEEKHAARALASLGVPVLRTISGRGTFEGADALWLDRRTVVCGVGRRTNREGFRQLREILKAQGVTAVAVPVPSGVQHLLGLLQIVDARLALVRGRIAPRSLVALLRKRRFTVVPLPETGEVTQRQGMNVVTVAPRKVLMPAGCPDLRRRYRAAGLTVAAELDIPQLRNGAGGLACAVGVLSRK